MWGYSPLDQIKRDNVQSLQLAWSWAMEDGAQESTPLVHHGIMYLPNPHGVIQAPVVDDKELWFVMRDQTILPRLRGAHPSRDCLGVALRHRRLEPRPPPPECAVTILSHRESAYYQRKDKYPQI